MQGAEYKGSGYKGSVYRATSLVRNFLLLGPDRRAMLRALWCSYGEGMFLMSQVPLYRVHSGGKIPFETGNEPCCCCGDCIIVGRG